MNTGFWSCIIFLILFMIIGVLFAVLKEKAAQFVSGFNLLSKEEQALYDKAYISRDIRNQCFTWAVIMLIGAVLSYFLVHIWLFQLLSFGSSYFSKRFTLILTKHLKNIC